MHSTPELPDPVVATYGSADPAAPLVVLLHGRGSNEEQILTAAPHLPDGPQYAAVRAPIAEGGGYAWFANRGIGRPVAESLRLTMDWFRRWLDDVAPAGRPVLLVGFSGGAAFAGGLALDDPRRYDGAAVLYGTLPFDAGVPTDRGRLANLPVLVAQGVDDHVIPRELLDRTWSYLHGESGAPTIGRRQPGGHELSATTLQHVGSWIAQRLDFLSRFGRVPTGPQARPQWATLPGGELPQRTGLGPDVSTSIPQQQLSDTSPAHLQEQLFARVSALAGVAVEPSRISVPGARAFTVRDGSSNAQAFLVPEVGEFAHLHPEHDGSLHLALPVELATDVTAQGWGRPHMWAGTRLSPGFVMVFGPRDETELEVVFGIVAASYASARDAGV